MITDSDWTSALSVEIGYYNPLTDSFSVISTSILQQGYGKIGTLAQWIFEVNAQSGSVTISKGDYLAINVTNGSSAAVGCMLSLFKFKQPPQCKIMYHIYSEVSIS